MADKKPCPFCGRTDVYRAYIEGGTMAYWCPHCQRLIPLTEGPISIIRKEVELSTKWLSFWIFCLIFGSLVALIFNNVLYLFVFEAAYPYYFEYSYKLETLPCALNIIFLVYNIAVGIGLYKRKLWAWKANWLIIAYPVIALFWLSLYGLSIFGPGETVLRDNLSPFGYFLFYGINLILILLLWIWPNYIYFRKRESLFS
jgi:hypothetical protein